MTMARFETSKARRVTPLIDSVKASSCRWSLRRVATEAPMKTP